MKLKLHHIVLAAIGCCIAALCRPAAAQTPDTPLYVIAASDEEEIDMSDFRIVTDARAFQIDFMNTSEKDLIAFLKGEVVMVDKKNKLIYQPGPSIDEMTYRLNLAVRNSTIDEIFRIFDERMRHLGPALPDKPLENLTDAEINAYNDRVDEFIAADKVLVGKVRDLLRTIQNLGYEQEAALLLKELNRRKDANAMWTSRFPKHKLVRTVIENDEND